MGKLGVAGSNLFIAQLVYGPAHPLPRPLSPQVDATHPDGWWYDGGGLYRAVRLRSAGQLRVSPWGVYVPTLLTTAPRDGRADAEVRASVELVNEGDEARSGVAVELRIVDWEGVPVAEAAHLLVDAIGANSNATVALRLRMSGAMLWSPDSPTLYRYECRLLGGGLSGGGLSGGGLLASGALADSVSGTFGVRAAVWDAERGLLLNGVPTKIKGMANHQDFGGVGVALPESLQAFRVWQMKRMGANAWRTAHNPPNERLLDECDAQGMLVWDENHRNRDSAEMLDDLRTMIRRDRNHPSVLIWSICNEVLCGRFESPEEAAIATRLEREIYALDPLGGRPVSAAVNSGYDGNFSRVLTLMGINYHPQLYGSYHLAHPQQPIIGSETSSAFSDRSVYENDTRRGYVSAYDENYPAWGNSAEDAWCSIASRDYVAGGFVWSGFDYKGEPTPYGWPNINSHFGAIDISGFPKDLYYYYQSVWFDAHERPVLHLLPHWNWRTAGGSDGEARGAEAGGAEPRGTPRAPALVRVWAFTNGAAVELFLNGQSIGKRDVQRCRHAQWSVEYVPGELEAIAYGGSGERLTRTVVLTTDDAVAIRATIDWPLREELHADGDDVALVRLSIVDVDGRHVVSGEGPAVEVEVSVEGPARIIGVGNGDPSSHEADLPINPRLARRTAWNGLVRVILQAVEGHGGEITVRARARGLTDAALSLRSLPVVASPPVRARGVLMDATDASAPQQSAPQPPSAPPRKCPPRECLLLASGHVHVLVVVLLLVSVFVCLSKCVGLMLERICRSVRPRPLAPHPYHGFKPMRSSGRQP